MSLLNRNLRTSVKRGNSIPAIITDVQGDRATARLAGNGAVYRSLRVTGGPVVIGQSVHVDFTTSEPTIVAPGSAGLAPANRGAKRANFRPVRPAELPGPPSGDVIWLTNAMSTVVGSLSGYPVTGEGLQTAITDIGSAQNYIIWMPKGNAWLDVGGDGLFTFPATTKIIGVGYTGNLADQSIISGKIVLNDGMYVEGIHFQEDMFNCSWMQMEWAWHVVIIGDVTMKNCYVEGMDNWANVHEHFALVTTSPTVAGGGKWNFLDCKFKGDSGGDVNGIYPNFYNETGGTGATGGGKVEAYIDGGCTFEMTTQEIYTGSAWDVTASGKDPIEVETAIFDTLIKRGPVIKAGTKYLPTFSPTEPTSPYVGQFWYKED